MGSLRYIVRVTMISTNVVLTISTCFFCSIHAMTINDESFEDKFNSSRSMNEDIKCATEFFVSRAKRDVRLWRRGVVPFRYDDSISREDKRVFEISMSLIEKKTCLRFYPARNAERPHILIQRQCQCGQEEKDGRKCFRGGFTNGFGEAVPRRLVIGSVCFRRNTLDILATHELFHALGVHHTQKRYDRNSYIKVLEENIQEKALSQYSICRSCKIYGIPYNCMSIMHYRDHGFAIRRGLKTMIPRSPNCDLTSRIREIPETDFQLLRNMYVQ